MAQVLHSLNDEWATIADSPMARRALMWWSDVHPVLLPAGNLAEVIELGYRPDIGPEIRRALALMAPEDHLAARTLLQELLGGLVNLARRVGRDGDAVDDVIGLAWERICTYPGHRPGTVSGNVLLDVRKRYRRLHAAPPTTSLIDLIVEPSAEDRVIGTAFLDDLRVASRANGVASDVLDTIIRSRVAGESMADLAAEQDVSLKVLWHRRWRGEARLRDWALSA